MKHIMSSEITMVEMYQILTAGVSPRPISLVSTIDEKGIPNLAPFSFYTIVGINPPLVAFTPIRRMRDGTKKHTCINIEKTKECVIQAVTYDIVEQVNLSSAEFDADINEFIKSGFTQIKSDIVKPYRVKESPLQMECKLHKIVELGGKNGSGDLIICEVLKLHLADEIFSKKFIDPNLLDAVGRNGRTYYTRAYGESIFKVEKAMEKLEVGYDNLPDAIKYSHTYTANEIARFANSEDIPSNEVVKKFINKIKNLSDINDIFNYEKTFLIHKKNLDNKKMLKTVLSLMLTLSDEEKRNKISLLKVMLENTAQVALKQNDYTFAWNTAMYVTML